MEKHKRRAFLERSKKPIHAFWEALAPVAQDLKDAYDELSPEWHKHDTDEFLQLMLINGCFILEILRVITTFSEAPPSPSQHQGDHPTIVRVYAPNDPVFSHHGELSVVPYLKRDMLILENQLVLQKLAALQKDESLKGWRRWRQAHLRHRTCRGRDHHQEDQIKKPHGHILQPRGPRAEATSYRGGRFHGAGVPEMAFKRFHVGAGNEVTSFVYFMDSLFESSSDVSMLHKCGVIQNAIRSEDDVAMLFHSLAKDVMLDPESRLDEVHRQISAYCSKTWSQWRPEIVSTYFTDPWAITAAAILLFVLTILQTIFSVLAYTNPR
ncbi:hypothetical protein SASPL_107416 [Salvia splendens]|uniref:Uncharacterized protein n=1 Tax=Salvia splendens TaxID=180675 RepID=A0A8X8YB28_SALSN|nr:hypothetical protein SASPL_107416 [Salvia splendens]